MQAVVSHSHLVHRREAIVHEMEAMQKIETRNWTKDMANKADKLIDELENIDRSTAMLPVRHDMAFRRYLRYGDTGLIADHRLTFSEAALRGSTLRYRGGQFANEQRATIGVEGGPPFGSYPGSTTGYVIPTSFWKSIISAASYTTPWLAISDVISTHGANPLPIAADNDIANSASIVTEGSAISSVDVSQNLTTLNGYPFKVAVKVSWEMQQDSGFSLEDYLTERFSKRMDRGLDAYFLTGSGSGQPTGVLNGLTPSVTASGSADTDGSGGANTIGLGDLVALEQALDPTYRANAKFMVHPNTLAALRKVKTTTTKEPIFKGLDDPNGPRLLGYPVVLSPKMAQLQSSPSSPTVSNVTVAFGDFSYFKIRLARPSLRLFTEPYAANAQTLYVLFWRVDSALVDGNSSNKAVVTLANTY